MSSIFNSRAYLDALSVDKTVRQVAEAMGTTFAQREYETESGKKLVFEKAVATAGE